MGEQEEPHKVENGKAITYEDFFLKPNESLKPLGLNAEQVEALVAFAGLLTTSGRILNAEFMQEYNEAKARLHELDLDLTQRTTEYYLNNDVRVFFGADWERPDGQYHPRGSRGELVQLPKKVEKSFIVNHKEFTSSSRY